jgi:hypothetical protein
VLLVAIELDEQLRQGLKGGAERSIFRILRDIVEHPAPTHG